MSDIPAADRLVTAADNQPPLAELLGEETADLKTRAEELVAGAGRCTTIPDTETAERATLLVGLMMEHRDHIEERREERKRPFLEACRTVDAHFLALRTAMTGPDAKGLGGEAGRIAAMVDAYRRAQEAKVAAERRRLEQEAESQRRAAEVAAEALRKAQAVGAPGTALQAEITQRHAEAAAQQAAHAASQVRAGPIDSGYGVKASGRKVYKVAITDLTAALRHCRKIAEAELRKLVMDIYARQVRANVRVLPGATVTEDTTTQFRRK